MKKKQKHWKIGTQRHRPFPVVQIRFRPVAFEEETFCGMDPCQNMVKPARALFLVQPCGPISLPGMPGFTKQEQSALLWEKAYREQQAGKEPNELAYPLCPQCSAFYIAQFLGDADEQRIAMAIAAAVSTGKDLILFDRNFTRDHTYPSLAVGTFDTLAQFREQYWKEAEG